MGVVNLLLFNLLFACTFLMTSSMPITDVNGSEARKIDLAKEEHAYDVTRQRFTLGEMASLLDMIDILTNHKASKSRDQEEYLFSALDKQFSQAAKDSFASPSSNENTGKTISTSSAVESASKPPEDNQAVAKRNPETELLKQLLSYKKKSRVNYVSRKLNCILTGFPGC